MESYVNKNYKNAIESLKVCQGVAKDSGNTYYYIELLFINGYSKRIYLNDDSRFALSNAFDFVDVSKMERLDNEA